MTKQMNDDLQRRLDSAAHEVERFATDLLREEGPRESFDELAGALSHNLFMLENEAFAKAPQKSFVVNRVMRLCVEPIRGLTEVLGLSGDADYSHIRSTTQIAYGLVGTASGKGPIVDLADGVARLGESIRGFRVEVDHGNPRENPFYASVKLRLVAAHALALLEYLRNAGDMTGKIKDEEPETRTYEYTSIDGWVDRFSTEAVMVMRDPSGDAPAFYLRLPLAALDRVLEERRTGRMVRFERPAPNPRAHPQGEYGDWREVVLEEDGSTSPASLDLCGRPHTLTKGSSDAGKVSFTEIKSSW